MIFIFLFPSCLEFEFVASGVDCCSVGGLLRSLRWARGMVGTNVPLSPRLGQPRPNKGTFFGGYFLVAAKTLPVVKLTIRTKSCLLIWVR